MLTVGVIGVGYWGPNLIRNFVNNPSCKVKAVSDLRPGRLEFIASQFPGVAVTENAEDILNDESIDAVVIATPVTTHKPLGLAALQKGKHVFIEKPLTDNAADAEALVALAEEKKKIIAVGHIFQFAPAVTAIKEQIEAGLLGDVFHLSSQRINLGPPKTTVDVMWDLAPHDLSIILYLFGSAPTKVTASGSSYLWQGFNDNVHIFMEFPGGRTAHVHTSWLSSRKTRRTLVFGEYGNIEYDETLPDESKVMYYDKGVDNRVNAKDNEAVKLTYGVGEQRAVPVVKGEPLALEVAAFIRAVETGIPPVNNGRIGMEVVKILEQATNSIKG